MDIDSRKKKRMDREKISKISYNIFEDLIKKNKINYEDWRNGYLFFLNQLKTHNSSPEEIKEINNIWLGNKKVIKDDGQVEYIKVANSVEREQIFKDIHVKFINDNINLYKYKKDIDNERMLKREEMHANIDSGEKDTPQLWLTLPRSRPATPSISPTSSRSEIINPPNNNIKGMFDNVIGGVYKKKSKKSKKYKKPRKYKKSKKSKKYKKK